MNKKDLLQSLVEEEDKLKRLEILEKNPGLLQDENPELVKERDTLAKELQTTKDELSSSRQKYIDTFFHGREDKDTGDSGKREPEESEITLDDFISQLTGEV